jgi:conjugative relaxase-like TrwC/TraI family protein
MGRGLAALGLAVGDVVTEAQLRNLFGERGRHPHADLIEADLLAGGKSPKAAWKAGALGRRVKVTGFDLVFRPQPTIYLLWALGDDETRRVIEAAHERAIERVLEWIEDQVAVIRFGKDGAYQVRPSGGLVAARFRHYEARSGMPLLHDHLWLSVKGQRLDGKWGSVHSEVMFENTVAASALYNEIVMAEVCEALGLASEPRTVTAGRRPVMEVAGVPHELIRWTFRRSAQIAACLTDLEHGYVAATDDGNLKFGLEVSERTRAKLNRIAARKTRPAKPRPRSLTQLRADWRDGARLRLHEASDLPLGTRPTPRHPPPRRAAQPGQLHVPRGSPRRSAPVRRDPMSGTAERIAPAQFLSLPSDPYVPLICWKTPELIIDEGG